MHSLTIPWPDPKQWRSWLWKFLLVAAILYIVYVARELWVPLGFAFLIATVLDPVVDRMQARGWSRPWASAFIFGTFLVSVGLAAAILGPMIVNQAGAMELEFQKVFPDPSPHGVQNSLSHMHLPGWLVAIAMKAYEGIQGGWKNWSTWLTSYGMQFLSNLVWVVIIPIVAFYALMDFHTILGKALLLIPSERRQTFQVAIGEGTAIFGKYLRGLAIVSVLNGMATWLVLFALGVPSPLLLGVLAGILYSVPYVGAMLTIVLVAAASFIAGGINSMLLVVGANVLLHQVIFDQIISPRIVGAQVGLHPIISIIALLIGNQLLGLVGMILAVPVAACIQIAILAVVPKLRHEIDISAVAAVSASDLAEETQEEHEKQDATETLHASVNDAIKEIESAIAAENGESTEQANALSQ